MDSTATPIEMSEEVQETNSGVKKRGNWREVAEFGEELEEAMEDSEIDEASVEKFNEWRPKTEEAEVDMREKTIDTAVMDEKKVEEESNGVRKDLKEAGEKVAEAGKKAREKNGEAGEELVNASEEAARPFLSKAIKLFRDFESFVYSKFSLRGDRFYLDTKDFSVDMKSSHGEYEMDVNVPQEEPRQQLREGIEGNNE